MRIEGELGSPRAPYDEATLSYDSSYEAPKIHGGKAFPPNLDADHTG